MKKETLEEASEKRIPTSTKIWDLTETRRSDFIAGAKWQAESLYSEEEVLELLLNRPGPYLSDGEIKEWFEQFKKK